jgi:hypothetical protein
VNVTFSASGNWTNWTSVVPVPKNSSSMVPIIGPPGFYHDSKPLNWTIIFGMILGFPGTIRIDFRRLIGPPVDIAGRGFFLPIPVPPVIPVWIGGYPEPSTTTVSTETETETKSETESESDGPTCTMKKLIKYQFETDLDLSLLQVRNSPLARRSDTLCTCSH